MLVAIIDDEIFDGHLPAGDLPEGPNRTQSIRRALKSSTIAKRVHWVNAIPMNLLNEQIRAPHHSTYIKHVYETAKLAESKEVPQWISNDAEVLVHYNSLPAIERAAGAMKQAVTMVLDPSSIRRVFCNVRPPGHHAHHNKGEGFCIFNNVWIAACEARRISQNPEMRIAIVDWDLHHGDGTQDFIMQHPQERNTLFFSIHQDYRTLWPGTGKDSTRGNFGTIHCKNMLPGSDDVDVQRYFDNFLLPHLRDFKPELILISCGFDGHTRDPLGLLDYTSELYGWMTKQLVAVAEECCGGRIVSTLEGGYDDRALAESSIFHVTALL